MNMKMLSFLLLAILTLRCLKPISAACRVDDEVGLLAFKSGITADPSNMEIGSTRPTQYLLRATPAQLSNWAKGPPSKPNAAPAHHLQPGQALGPTNPGKPRVTSLSSLSGSTRPTQYLLRAAPALLSNWAKGPPGKPNATPAHHLQLRAIPGSHQPGQAQGQILPGLQPEGADFYYNKFTGPILSSISKLTRLTQLNMGGNLLTGSIPYDIKNLKSLSLFNLEQNGLSGPIPDFFSSFSELQILRLSQNKFSGKIPASISALAPKLAYLELGHNALTGQIPDFLGNFKALDTLYLSYNGFSGIVPQRLVNLAKIFNLDLSHNYLIDPFPQLNVKGIESLDLSYNSFHLNQIPKWVTSLPIIYSLKLAKSLSLSCMSM
ncbi:hypothetical protein GBA52_008328 [Prunus armeniaca]|nr:hypothetical protein GBA52_008328 [Prunus armeniaca]